MEPDLRQSDSAELLAAVVEAGLTTPGARLALEQAGGLGRMARLGPERLERELASVRGWPRQAARRLSAALELGRRATCEQRPLGPVVHHVADLEEHLLGWFGGLSKEVFGVLLLDAKHRLLRTVRVSEGCLTWSVVHPREVFAPAVHEGAGALIVAHNHPSGDPTPSRQDFDVTARLVRAGELLGIPVLDHVIVGGGRCVSVQALGATP